MSGHVIAQNLCQDELRLGLVRSWKGASPPHYSAGANWSGKSSPARSPCKTHQPLSYATRPGGCSRRSAPVSDRERLLAGTESRYPSGMFFGNAAFLVGPVSALLMVPLAMAVIAVLRRPRWAVFATVVLAAAVGVTWLVYWVLWYQAFDYLDAGRPVPSPIDAASNMAMALCAGSVLLLGATAVGTITLAWRTKSMHR